MVAKTTELPNLRSMFPPDDGFTMAEFDLAQADAQVVASESNDETLKQIFREKLDLHTENAKTIFGKSHITHTERQKAKVGVHAVDYGCKARTLATNLAITVAEAEKFIKTWFEAHPGIEDWHKRIDSQLKTTSTIENKFGFRRFYMGKSSTLLSEALAWIPQSTVAIITYKGMLTIRKNYKVSDLQLLMQNHDSVLLQARDEICMDALRFCKQALEVPVPYDDPLIIPVGCKASKKNWGSIVDPFKE